MSVEACWCSDCEVKRLSKLSPLEQMTGVTMCLCSTCGNKRCPRATNHELECTHSNEPGQRGSRYA